MNPFLISLYSLIAVGLVLVLAALAIIAGGKRSKKKKTSSVTLDRHPKNPVISPLPHREWEAQGTFNPAAVTDDHGNVHLLYRAIGADGMSQIGHADSDDGLEFHQSKRSSFPVYQPFGHAPQIDLSDRVKAYDPTIYTSGGGWGGCEDPRAVRIGDRVYMTYTAFEGWESVRIALTSIAVEDLRKNRWNWKKPVLISDKNQVNKNWVLFPEKIRGKFAILHSLSPDVRIDYIDDLDMYARKPVKSQAPRGGREGSWDNWVRGAGPPPIKTEKGWLLLYHAMDRNDPDKYKLGAMLLDLDDPTKVLYRSPAPILSPDMCYENDGKPGVVYASGAVVKDKNLYVYYGGGDKHVCMAQTPLRPLLEWLVAYGRV